MWQSLPEKSLDSWSNHKELPARATAAARWNEVSSWFRGIPRLWAQELAGILEARAISARGSLWPHLPRVLRWASPAERHATDIRNPTAGAVCFRAILPYSRESPTHRGPREGNASELRSSSA